MFIYKKRFKALDVWLYKSVMTDVIINVWEKCINSEICRLIYISLKSFLKIFLRK